MLQPSTELQLPLGRTYASVLNSAIGSVIISHTINSTSLGGFYTQPFRVPTDYDRSRPGHVFAYIAQPPGGPGPAAGNIALVGSVQAADPTAGVTSNVGTPLIPIAAAWPADQVREIEITGPTGPLIPASFIPPNAVLGLRLYRNGPSPSDTWTGTLNLADFLRLRYSRLCQHCDSCT